MSKKPYVLPSGTDQEVVRVCNEMWDYGYSKVGHILNPEEAALLKDIFETMMKAYRPWSERWTNFKPTEYFLPPFGDACQVMLSNIAGRDSRSDLLLEKIMTNKRVKESLTLLLGQSYKVWELSVRRSNPTDHGLSLHQDAIGEFGISVLLNDQFDSYGTTSLVPRSHRLRVNCREAGVENYLRPSFMRRFTVPLVGSAGDVYFFFKKTWHGRVQGKKAVSSDSLLFGLFPTGYRFKPFDIPLDNLHKLPDELRRLLRTDEGLVAENEGYYRVQGNAPTDRIIDLIYRKEHAINTIWNLGPYIKTPLDSVRSVYINLRNRYHKKPIQ